MLKLSKLILIILALINLTMATWHSNYTNIRHALLSIALLLLVIALNTFKVEK